MNENNQNDIVQEINFIHIPVSNIDEAINWYVSFLGCIKPHKVHDKLASVNLPSGPTLLLVKSDHEIRARFVHEGRNYSIIGLLTKDIEKAYSVLKDNGVIVENIRDEGLVGKFFDFYDLYGNMFTIWGCSTEDYNDSLNKVGAII